MTGCRRYVHFSDMRARLMKRRDVGTTAVIHDGTAMAYQPVCYLFNTGALAACSATAALRRRVRCCSKKKRSACNLAAAQRTAPGQWYVQNTEGRQVLLLCDHTMRQADCVLRPGRWFLGVYN